jgi:DNA-binding CsgD family transcriptional regulator
MEFEVCALIPLQAKHLAMHRPGDKPASATEKFKILPAIRPLYQAATDADKWPVFLKELSRCFDADGAHIVRVQPHERVLSFSALYGYDDVIRRKYGGDGVDLPSALARFEQHFTQLMPTDPRVRFLEQYPSRPLSCRSAISDAELHSSKVYKDMLKDADIEYSLVASAPEDDGSLIMFGVFRSRRSTYFTECETEAFGELIPHVKEAVSLSEHLARVDVANRLAFEALDGISMGILLVDENARVIHANAAARRITDMADGISLHNGTLRLRGKDEDQSLRRALWNVIAKIRAGDAHSGEAIAVARPSGNEPFPLLIGTLWGNHLRYGLGRLDRPVAVVFVTIPEEPREAPAELLRRLFGLTPAEAKICERVVQGDTLEEAAKDLDIATATARVYLKSVFAKTGVGRQAELVAKILATPVWLRHWHLRDRALARERRARADTSI